jgi:hypothetical protein
MTQGNPKSEARNPKQIQMKERSKFKTRVANCFRNFPLPSFEFVSDFGFRISCLFISMMLFLSGCTSTKVIPPVRPQEPVTVYLTDYGRHSSVLIPSINGGGDYDEWAFGDYEFFAKGDTRWWVAIRAMLHSPQATLGRRQIKNASMVSQESLMKALGDCRRLMRFEASRVRAEALELQLDTQFRNGAAKPLYSSYSTLYHVPDSQPYWVLHNCNHVTAHWLRRLGCEICGPAIYSNFKLAEISPQPAARSTSQPTTQKK